MRIGVQFQTHGVDPRRFSHAVDQVLNLGVDAVYLWDHLVPFTGQRDESSWDSWTLLGSIVQVFAGSDSDLGILVSPLSYREPAVIARAAATLARIGNGRFILGVGVGGFDFDDELVSSPRILSDRLARFSERIERTRWEVDRQNVLHGTDVALWVGGMGERVTIPLARQFADGWSGFGPPSEFAAKLADLHEPKMSTSVLLTSRDVGHDVRAYMNMGAGEVIRSLAPTAQGTFDVSLVEQLLAERDLCR